MNLPASYVVLRPDNPKFTVIAATNEYLDSVGLELEQLIGKGLFEPFTPSEDSARLKDSLSRIVITKDEDVPIVVKHVVNGETKYWSSKNVPLLNDSNELMYILHCPIEITNLMKLGLNLSI